MDLNVPGRGGGVIILRKGARYAPAFKTAGKGALPWPARAKRPRHLGRAQWHASAYQLRASTYPSAYGMSRRPTVGENTVLVETSARMKEQGS